MREGEGGFEVCRGGALPLPPVLHNVSGGVEPRPYTVIARSEATWQSVPRARRRGDALIIRHFA